MSPEHEQSAEEYWTVDEAIGEVVLWHGEPSTLRLQAHIAEELYRQGPSAEIIPLRHPLGVRTNLNARAYVLVPDIRLDVRPNAAPARSDPAGIVHASTWEGMKAERIGSAQAWYYHEDRALILWECFLEDRYRGDNPAEDPNAYALWEGFERFLIGRFPQARTIATTSDENLYELAQYQAFLGSMGYRELHDQAFGKDLTATSPPQRQR
jgi:hypothetical protein